MWIVKFVLILLSLANPSFADENHEAYCDACGKIPASYRVANGEIAKHAPWAVYIKVYNVASTEICTGVLVHWQWVLTAGHCVEDLAHLTHHQQSFSVQLFFGMIDMRNPKNAPFEMPAVGVYLHQHYSNKDPANPINDIAAIELANAFSPSHYPTVAPICLGPDASPDDSVTIIGYGITDCDVNQQKTCYHRATVSKSAGNQSYRRAKHRAAQRSSEPSILRQGTQIVRSQKFCVDMYKRTKKNITKGMLCTKNYKGSPVMSCIGDSGGAVWMEKSMKNHSDKRALLVGIISFGGPSEGLKEAPDISTRVKGYLTWIQATSRNLVKPCWL